MNLLLNPPDSFYEMEKLCRLFFPDEHFTKNPPASEGNTAACNFQRRGSRTVACCRLTLNGATTAAEEPLVDADGENAAEIAMARGLYRLLCRACGVAPAWGVLTGVRPGKLYAALRQAGRGEADRVFRDRLLVSPTKIALCRAVYEAEQKATVLTRPEAFSLYVSIPFCPTRCSYCSFVSHSVEKTQKLVEPYVDLLCEELALTARQARAAGVRLQTVYFGGGTPTQLSADQLDRLLRAVEQAFDLSHLLEYTVEAGRPDTVTQEKLQVLKAHGVGRVSVNPQTMHDSVLSLIGRRHSVAQVIDAVELVRQAGFRTLNMDLIAGLPGDSPAGFEDSLRQVLALNPENITVHTLSLKRSSRLAQKEGAALPGAEAVADMLKTADDALTAAGYRPYYLYRQSKMLGNLENVGWAKPGHECLYNLAMMNELHTVLAAGAGGVTRLKQPGGPAITRIFNVKYPYEYSERFVSLMQRKKGIGEFYEQYPVAAAAAGGARRPANPPA